MDLGAMVCTRTKPRCDACPVAGDCVARRNGRILALPSPRPRKVLPQRAVILLLLERDGALLFEQRPPIGIWSGLWSVPEVRVDDESRDIDALASAEVRARFGIEPEVCERLAPVTHVFTHFALTMHPVRVALRAPFRAMQSPALEWLTLDAALEAGLPAPIRRLVRSLAPAQA
jgi:A/G-specific adenine glycosylase